MEGLRMISLASVCLLPLFLAGMVSTDGQKYCFLKPAVGDCDGVYVRWFYNPTEEQCQKFEYGGCGGNKKRFLTRAKCQAACADAEEDDDEGWEQEDVKKMNNGKKKINKKLNKNNKKINKNNKKIKNKKKINNNKKINKKKPVNKKKQRQQE